METRVKLTAIEEKASRGETLNLTDKRSLLTEIQEREVRMNAILDEYNNLNDKQAKAGQIDELRQEYKRLTAELHEIYILTTSIKK